MGSPVSGASIERVTRPVPLYTEAQVAMFAARINCTPEKYQWMRSHNFRWCRLGAHWVHYRSLVDDHCERSGRRSYCKPCYGKKLKEGRLSRAAAKGPTPP